MVAVILTKLAYLIVPDLENLEAQADCNSEIEMTSIPQGVDLGLLSDSCMKFTVSLLGK